ncbi:MAG: carboxypeptidase regulatory-like domain-containing protein [Nitrospirae bacterium]|nr:carboxypeptidase regulatory-like domain-containing protein [Candidatus Manganitrophaceae bacterium]
MRRALFIPITGLLLMGWILSSGRVIAAGYEEAEVSHGGTVTGKITLKGEIPEPRVFPLVLYPFGPFCKKISDGEGNVRLKEFIVGKEGGLGDAVVAIVDVKKGKPFKPIKSNFVAVDCMFHPAEVPDNEQFSVEDGKVHHEHPNVTVLENHQPISMLNKDPVIHNIQVFQNEKGNIILNVPLPVSTEPHGGMLNFASGKRISQMICGMHEFMQSWGFVVDNPYYTKTKKGGEFMIDQLPPGTYQIIAWHPHFKIVRKEITVPPDGNVTINFEFNSSDVQRPIYETQKDRRISPATPHNHMLEEGEDRIIID